MTHKKIKTSLMLLSVVLLLLLAACGGKKDNQTEEDANLAITQVYETAMVALTQTAAVQPSTPTPTNTEMPTATTPPTLAVTPTSPLPSSTSPSFIQPTNQTSSCDIGGFVRDVTIPDGRNMSAGEDFTKTWEIKNNGTCTWNEDYTVIYYSGEQMADDTMYAFTTEDIEPGESVNISVPMTAPTTTGSYNSYWVLRNDLGQTFFIDGGAIYVEITVGSGTAAPTSAAGTATATVSNTYPVVTITSPVANGGTETITFGTSVTLTGAAQDAEDDDTALTNQIVWTSSRDGQLGIAASLNISTLSVGTHTITATITDSDGGTDSATITIIVN